MRNISVVIITKNEEHNIRECLECVKWADEIIVVDTFSTDKTIEICKEYTDKIFQRELKGYSDQKQFGIDKATGEWILSIDADERISPGLRDELLTAVKEDKLDGLSYYRPTVFLGQTLQYSGLFEPPLLRFFKKDKGHFDNTIADEHLIFKGRSQVARNPLIHLYLTEGKNISGFINKLNVNTSNQARDLVRKGVVLKPNNYIWYFFIKPFLVFARGYILKQGFRRGFPGFLWYLLRAFLGYFISYAKLWEWQLNNKNKKV